MVSILGMKDCEVCEESKKMLDDHGIEYGFIDVSLPENLPLVRKFKIKVAGRFLYDDKNDTVISVPDYINQVHNNE